MDWSDFSGKKIALLGAGKENLSLIPYLENAGASVAVCEQWEKDLPSNLPTTVERRTGPDHLSDLDQFDYLFRSPGLPISRIDTALKGKVNQPIRTTAMDLFLSLGLCTTIGVTGTKGKGTTTTMIAAILKAAGRDTIVAGNIGEVIFDHLGRITKQTIVVMELSSFQLEDISHSPAIAVVLPVTRDHLEPQSERSPNFHPSLEAYVQAKANICAYQSSTDLVIYAADSPSATAIAEPTQSRKISVGQKVEADIQVDDTGKITSGNELLFDLSSTGLRGTHIFLDATLAITVAREFDATTEQITAALQNYQALPHRLQTVGTIDGITYVDDSYATAPDATEAAIKAFQEPIVWIGGGVSRGATFDQLVSTVVASTVKAVILIGQMAPKIKTLLEQANFSQPILEASSMSEAVGKAQQRATTGDVVLLSPACKSYDMFQGADDRGNQFQAAVKEGKDELHV